MKKLFVEAKSYHTAKRYAPWAAKIARTEGGFIAFESVLEYYVWKRQK